MISLSFSALAAILLGYLLGSIPFGLILTKLAGLGDIRQVGSGNIGATNVLRTGNKKLALATLLLDGIKGVVAVVLARLWGMENIAPLVGVAAIMGHIFPVWLRFKGGKGVATTLAVLLVISWPVGVVACVVWLGVFLLTKYSSLSSLSAVTGAGIAAFFLTSTTIFYCVLALALVVIIRHHQNIKRLLKGQESKSRVKKQA